MILKQPTTAVLPYIIFVWVKSDQSSVIIFRVQLLLAVN